MSPNWNIQNKIMRNSQTVKGYSMRPAAVEVLAYIVLSAVVVCVLARLFTDGVGESIRTDASRHRELIEKLDEINTNIESLTLREL